MKFKETIISMMGFVAGNLLMVSGCWVLQASQGGLTGLSTLVYSVVTILLLTAMLVLYKAYNSKHSTRVRVIRSDHPEYGHTKRTFIKTNLGSKDKLAGMSKSRR